MAKTLNDEMFKKEVLESGEPCLVDFFAEWCGPCKMMSPVISELSKKYEGRFGIFKYDVEHSGTIAGKYGVMSIPTLIFFKGGKPAETLVGALPKEILEKKIEAMLK